MFRKAKSGKKLASISCLPCFSFGRIRQRQKRLQSSKTVVEVSRLQILAADLVWLSNFRLVLTRLTHLQVTATDANVPSDEFRSEADLKVSEGSAHASLLAHWLADASIQQQQVLTQGEFT